MASDYCYSKEMQRAMQRHEQKEARIIPIFLRPTYWKGAPFEKLQFLPTQAKPITDEAIEAYKQAQVLGSPHPDPQFYHEQKVVYERLAQRAYDEEKQAKEHWKPTREHNLYKSFVWFEKKPALLHVLSGHTSYVFGVAFGPDGQVLASGSYDYTIKLWNVQTGEELYTLSGYTADVNVVALVPMDNY